MNKKRRWLWVILFIFLALLLSTLATGWNLVLFRDYENIRALIPYLTIPREIHLPKTHLVVKMVLGTLGFVAVLTLAILLFIKLLREMRLNQLQSEFLATVSHELKTPISAIELSASLLQTGGLSSSETARLWQSHRNELKRLRDEVEALLEAARWQSKGNLKENSTIHLETWIEQSLPHWKSFLGPEGTFTREGDPLPFHISLNLKALELIMGNLMSNAKKYAKGQPQIILRTSLIPKKGSFSKQKWKIQIEDQGWGFDPNDSRKIFQRFFRAKVPAPYAIPGTGLGLFLARSASRAMKLTLTGKSNGIGQGATFTIEGSITK